MRELVYLSPAKIGQFQRKPRRLGGVSGSIVVKGGADALPTAEVGLNYDPAKGRQAQDVDLDGVLEIIYKTWPVKWWTEADITPGEWIQFENRLNFGVIAAEMATVKRGQKPTVKAGPTALLFWGNEQHDLSISPRLLLHGSVTNLVPTRPGCCSEPVPRLVRV